MRSAEDYLLKIALRNNRNASTPNTCMEIIPYSPSPFPLERLIVPNPLKMKTLNEQLTTAAHSPLRALSAFHKQQVEILKTECEQTVRITEQNCQERVERIHRTYGSIMANTRAHVERERNALNAKLDVANGTIDSLKDQLNTANGTIVDLRQGVHELNNQIENLNHQSNDLNTQLDHARRNMADLRNEINNLSQKLLLSINEQTETFRFAKGLELAVKELLIEGDEKDQEIATLKGRVLELTGQLAGRDAIIAERDQAITNLGAQRAALAMENNALNHRLAQRIEEIDQRNAEVAQRDQAIANLDAERAGLVIERGVTIAQNEAELAQRDAAIAQRNAIIAQQEANLAQRDVVIAERNQAVNNLNAQREALVVERDGLNVRARRAESGKAWYQGIIADQRRLSSKMDHGWG